ncbi:TatD DNase family Scn1 [Collybia nuda]|uniref:TatD DNase family Scn1 n=1 Tax=Collybia nuda TaxID=64659 RepID=A0A9P6CKQ4_9AGAR|nr:TatD DNase family Scn1 [Collybia nuda]
MPLPGQEILNHIVDVHCHPTDASSISPDSMHHLQITICAMSTMQSDQSRVRDLAISYPTKVVPCFGYHPWFSYLISTQPVLSKNDHYRSILLGTRSPRPSDVAIFEKLLDLLPDPIFLHDVISELRLNLEAFPRSMLGEVGLDRTFRVPFDYFASNRELTPFTIPLEHQLTILEAQVDLAVELGRNVSFHSVKSQLATVEFLKRLRSKHRDRWARINIDMHSCGLSPETWREIEKGHSNVFLSLSTVINSRSPNHRALIANCLSDRLLVESDYNNIDMCTDRTWDMIKIVAEVKGWQLEEEWIEDLDRSKWGVVRKLEENWFNFRRGYNKFSENKEQN